MNKLNQVRETIQCTYPHVLEGNACIYPPMHPSYFNWLEGGAMLEDGDAILCVHERQNVHETVHSVDSRPSCCVTALAVWGCLSVWRSACLSVNRRAGPPSCLVSSSNQHRAVEHAALRTRFELRLIKYPILLPTEPADSRSSNAP